MAIMPNNPKKQTKMAQNEFIHFVIENGEAQKHAQEIQQTRVGGLGGSDASILLKIGMNGMEALNATETKRLAIMMGRAKQNDWGGNAYTNAGHAFEDYAEKALPFGPNGYEREKYLSQPLAVNFKTFAHADFWSDNTVVECKFVQDTTANVIRKYMPQLQWYYMIGARNVVLYHGTGNIEPFEVLTGETISIERDETLIQFLLAGIKTLDDAIGSGWLPESVDKIAYENTPEIVQRAFDKLSEIKAQEITLSEQKDEAQQIIKKYIEDFGFSGIIADGEIKRQIIYTPKNTSFSFDAEKFLKEHLEFNLPCYFKQRTTKSSIKFK